MIPRAHDALLALAGRLGMDAAALGSTYDAANAGMTAMLLQALGAELERGVANRLADIDDLRSIFAAAASAPEAPARAAWSARTPQTLALSDVAALHSEGLELLVTLHASAEALGDTVLELRIWDFLYRHTERGSLDV